MDSKWGALRGKIVLPPVVATRQPGLHIAGDAGVSPAFEVVTNMDSKWEALGSKIALSPVVVMRQLWATYMERIATFSSTR